MYKNKLVNSLSTYFDVLQESIELPPVTFELKATFNQRNAKYLLVKKMEFYSFTNNEYIFYKKIDSHFDFSQLKSVLEAHTDSIITLDREHMSSYITFILEVPDTLDRKTQRTIEKFKFHKSYFFGLKGWVNARLIVINPTDKIGYANKFGKKELPKYLEIAN